VATQTRAPISDVSVTGSWTGSNGTRYQAVDDFPDTSVDSLTHGITGGVLRMGFTPFTVPAGSTIIAVRIKYYVDEPAAGTNSVRARMEIGTAAYTQSSQTGIPTAPAAPALIVYERTTNPENGSAPWTVDQVNGVGAAALQPIFGIGSADANPTVRFWSAQIEVEYTEPPVGPRIPILLDHYAKMRMI
jgi:hypothetical protein